MRLSCLGKKKSSVNPLSKRLQCFHIIQQKISLGQTYAPGNAQYEIESLPHPLIPPITLSSNLPKSVQHTVRLEAGKPSRNEVTIISKISVL